MTRPRVTRPRGAALAMLLRDSQAAATAAELRYVSLDEPGISRRARARSFIYLKRGRPIRDPSELGRIAALGIPPAWKNVWICPRENGHIQAIGYDAKGRKQYRYHPRWRQLRDQAKYHDILLFAEALPLLRRRLAADLASTELTKHKVLATVVKIMEHTRVRVGNDRYVESNDSYGLTTLLDQHARISGAHVEFKFRGKGGKPYRAAIRDRRLAGIVKRCRDIPGQRLFQYIDDKGVRRPITSTDVNLYIREATGQPFTAKAFRTWAATVGAASVLAELEPSQSEAHGRRVLKRAIEHVAESLGNTQAICRKSYVHPLVMNAYVEGHLHAHMPDCIATASRSPRKWLRREESAVLHLFDRLARKRFQAAA